MFEDSDFSNLSHDLDRATIENNNLRHSILQLEGTIKGLNAILHETCSGLEKNGVDLNTVPKLKEWWLLIKEKERQENESREKSRVYLEWLMSKPFCHLTAQEKSVLQKHGLY
jgi:hypothetical protein